MINAKRSGFILVFFLLFFSVLAGANSIRDQYKKPFDESRKELLKLICKLPYETVKLLERDTELISTVSRELYLVDIPRFWRKHRAEIEISDDLMKDLEGLVSKVEENGQHYHWGDYKPDRKLATLSLEHHYDGVDVIVGYRCYKPDDKASKVFMVCNAGEQKVCETKAATLDEYFKNKSKSFLQLHHAPEEYFETFEDLVKKPENVQAPLRVSAVQAINLVKTGEVFTDPEIFAVVEYFDANKKSVRKDEHVDLKFALKKGENRGFKRLIRWSQDVESVMVLIFEDDRDIPFDVFFKVCNFALKKIPNLFGYPTGFLLDDLKPVFAALRAGENDDELNNEEEGFLDYLKSCQEDDLIGVFHLEKKDVQYTDKEFQRVEMGQGGSVELDNYYEK